MQRCTNSGSNLRILFTSEPESAFNPWSTYDQVWVKASAVDMSQTQQISPAQVIQLPAPQDNPVNSDSNTNSNTTSSTDTTANVSTTPNANPNSPSEYVPTADKVPTQVWYKDPTVLADMAALGLDIGALGYKPLLIGGVLLSAESTYLTYIDYKLGWATPTDFSVSLTTLGLGLTNQYLSVFAAGFQLYWDINRDINKSNQ